jgi:hypothetical protein
MDDLGFGTWDNKIQEKKRVSTTNTKVSCMMVGIIERGRYACPEFGLYTWA